MVIIVTKYVHPPNGNRLGMSMIKKSCEIRHFEAIQLKKHVGR